MRRFGIAFALGIVLFGIVGTRCAPRTAALSAEPSMPRWAFSVGCVEPWGFDEFCAEVAGYGEENLKKVLAAARKYVAAYGVSWAPKEGETAWRMHVTFGGEKRNLNSFLSELGLLGFYEAKPPHKKGRGA